MESRCCNFEDHGEAILAVASIGDDLDDAFLEPKAHPLLDDAERLRLGRLLTPLRRKQFIIGRSLAKNLLATMHSINPLDIEIRIGNLGQPSCWSRHDRSFLSWLSISHAGQWVAVAASQQGPVGVDVEQTLHGPKLLELQDHILHQLEKLQFDKVPTTEKSNRLLRVFSLKESILKAKGTGLTEPLCNLYVGLGDVGHADGDNLDSRQIVGPAASSRSSNLDAEHVLSLTFLKAQ